MNLYDAVTLSPSSFLLFRNCFLCIVYDHYKPKAQQVEFSAVDLPKLKKKVL